MFIPFTDKNRGSGGGDLSEVAGMRGQHWNPWDFTSQSTSLVRATLWYSQGGMQVRCDVATSFQESLCPYKLFQ